METSSHPTQGDRAAHNMIEKRYRMKLNDQIAALRDSVPSLRATSRLAEGADDEQGAAEDLEGLAPAHKLNKATVLAKAIEYIRHLEKRNKTLVEEMATLRLRLEAYEKLYTAGLMGVSVGQVTPSDETTMEKQFAAVVPDVAPLSLGGPQGLIPIPENIRRLQQSRHIQIHYAHKQIDCASNNTTSEDGAAPGQQIRVSGPRSGKVGKLMIGSLAAIMVIEGFRAREDSEDVSDRKGLSALPVSLLNSVVRPVYSLFLNDHLASLLKASFVLAGLLLFFLCIGQNGRKSAFNGYATCCLGPVWLMASYVEFVLHACLTALRPTRKFLHHSLQEFVAFLVKKLLFGVRILFEIQRRTSLAEMTNDEETGLSRAQGMSDGLVSRGG